MTDENQLVATCLALMNSQASLSKGERELARRIGPRDAWATDLDSIRAGIIRGEDPLGEMFTQLRPAHVRRCAGAVYTAASIVRSMLSWIRAQGTPGRVVDPGAGSGRFLLAAGAAFADAKLVAVEMDPLAALMLRANLAVRGWARRSQVIVGDYRSVQLPHFDGTTAFVGNPPYVRHHGISEEWKHWYASRFAQYGIKASSLAGLHLHFFLQTLLLARPGDLGAYVTSAEWLDVNYGSALRRLLLDHLGGTGLHVLEPQVEAFPGVATTAAITCFRVGETRDSVRVRSIARLQCLGDLSDGTDVPVPELRSSSRWSSIVRPVATQSAPGIELGELFRVHRGQVTGANDIWIASERAQALPERVKLPTVTKAKDLLLAGPKLITYTGLRKVVDLPVELDAFNRAERKAIDDFLEWAKQQGAHSSYIARHRRSWWSVGLRSPAPILCTYMARRPPQFTLNECAARHINIAHGLYPREPIPELALARIVDWLNTNTLTAHGRTYAGGLTKFEPKEIERIRIPAEALALLA